MTENSTESSHLNTATLAEKASISKPTYESSVIQGLLSIKEHPYGRELDRHIVMAIPNSLATTEGTEANLFLKRAGNLKRDVKAGVPVTLSLGQTFISTQTGEQEQTLLLDFEYTEATDMTLVANILSN